VTLNFINGMQFASGYDSTTGGFLGTTNCLVPVAPPTLVSPSQLQSSFSLTTIESKSDLSDALDVGAEGSYNAGVTTVSASAQFVQSQDTNNYNVGMILMADAIGQNYSLYDTQTKPQLTPDMQTLYDTDYKKFKDSCGDYFLNTMTLGGRYVAYFNFTSYSKDQKQSIAAKLKASEGPFEVSAEFSKKMQSLASTSTLSITTFQTAIPGTPSSKLEDLINDAQNFPEKVLLACADSEGLKSCVKSGTFNSYQNFFGPPETKSLVKSLDAINAGAAERRALVLRGTLVDRLIGSSKVIALNPSIYDPVATNTVADAMLNAPTWKIEIDEAIVGCNNDITQCQTSMVLPTGAEGRPEQTYGMPLPTYAALNTAVHSLPDVTASLPTSCGDHQKIYGQSTDGDYAVFIDKDITMSYKLFCRDMAPGSTPLDYLNLGTMSKTESVVDYTDSQSTIGYTGAKLDGKQTTTFTKVRIDPATLLVDPNDVTYTKNTGYLVQDGIRNDQTGVPPSIPLGNSAQCNPNSNALTATATIDLSYTPLIFDSADTSFSTGGWQQSLAGVATPSDDKKTYSITSGHGFCSGTHASNIRLHLAPN
jgi:hypothetical protein